MDSLLIASNNKAKTKEIKRILGKFYKNILTPAEIGLNIEVDETGTSFEENAVLKAKAFSDASGMDAIADDSGLVVDALGGAPGIYSARFSREGTDEANNRLLLEKLKGVPEHERKARYIACVAIVFKDGKILTTEGKSEGRILESPIGENGFGYDPLFYDENFKKSYAQLTPEQKDSISHRGKALRLLADKLEKIIK